MNKLSISSHTALILGLQALMSYLRLTYEYESYALPDAKISTTKDHGENYMKVKPPMVRHLLRNRLFVNFESMYLGIRSRFAKDHDEMFQSMPAPSLNGILH